MFTASPSPTPATCHFKVKSSSKTSVNKTSTSDAAFSGSVCSAVWKVKIEPSCACDGSNAHLDKVSACEDKNVYAKPAADVWSYLSRGSVCTIQVVQDCQCGGLLLWRFIIALCGQWCIVCCLTSMPILACAPSFSSMDSIHSTFFSNFLTAPPSSNRSLLVPSRTPNFSSLNSMLSTFFSNFLTAPPSSNSSLLMEMWTSRNLSISLFHLKTMSRWSTPPSCLWITKSLLSLNL